MILPPSAGRWRGRPRWPDPGDGTSTMLGSWDLGGLIDQLDAIYPEDSRDTSGPPES